ncbi:MAG: RidA family protein [Alphaproteobacteria bacterium]|nr:RidA family protein [Alphaproteobacteria bacterium]
MARKDISRIGVSERYSKATVHDGTVYVAVQYPDRPDPSPTNQTREVLAKIDWFLAQAGTDKSRLLKATVFVADIADFAAINAVWDAWVVPGSPPARTPVLGPLLRPEVRVAIELIAAV